MAMTSIPTTRLKDGTSIPVIGYGTGAAWFKKKGDTSVNRELVESIKTAIRLGYHHLDIKECGVPRKQLFVTTKVNQNIANISKAIEDSLEKLQLSYVDLYLIHQPFFAKSPTDLQDGWAAMEKVKEAGKARGIGVSKFLESHLEIISQSAKIPPTINQIEYHPYLQHGSLVRITRRRELQQPITDRSRRLLEREGVRWIRCCRDRLRSMVLAREKFS
ncbi:NADP-dependent oxidoreductase domain-containing protein [Aspergillus desertorum]